MSTNAEVVAVLDGIADLLDLRGERFKPEAYRRAARAVQSLDEDLRAVAQRGELRAIPGIGEAIEEKIEQYLRTGRVDYYDRLRQEVPAGVLDLMHLPGIGPKTARRFLVEFQIEGPAELLAAIDAGRLHDAAGFGPRKIALFRAAVAPEGAAGPGGRSELWRAAGVATTVARELTERAPIDRLEVAGSLRRRRETVGDLDFLVTSEEPEKVFDVFTGLPGVREVKLRGETKETIVYGEGIQIDLRVLAPESFGAGLAYFTGSKDHNIRLRTIARDRGLKINEYGVFRGETRIAGRTEEEVYAALELPLIPPEIRENHGEIEAARKGKLPTLVEEKDLRGDLHVHLPKEPDEPTLERIVSEARRRKWEYVGLVGLSASAVRRRTGRSRKKTRAGEPTLWVGEEIPLTERGPERPPNDAFDFWVACLPARWATTGKLPSLRGRDRPPLYVGHTLPTEAREPAGDRLAGLVEWARREEVPLELSPRAALDGLDSGSARRAVAEQVPLALSAHAESPAELVSMELSVGLARRAWVVPSAVLNGRPRSELRRARADALRAPP